MAAGLYALARFRDSKPMGRLSYARLGRSLALPESRKAVQGGGICVLRIARSMGRVHPEDPAKSGPVLTIIQVDQHLLRNGTRVLSA